MKKIANHKLTLSRETLKNLGHDQLAFARGAAPQESVTRCGTDCCSAAVCSAAGVGCGDGFIVTIIKKP